MVLLLGFNSHLFSLFLQEDQNITDILLDKQESVYN